MKATEILVEEHRVIEKVLACLERIVADVSRDGKLNAESANAAIEFFKNFADQCHHAKEEDRLFGVMEAGGVPVDGGPIGVMLSEHEMGRKCVRGMAAQVEKAATGDAAAIGEFRQNAMEFIALLSAHIQKENQILFPMANNVLGDRGGDNLLSEFRQIEADAGGKRHAEWLGVARKLCERHKIPFVEDGEIGTLRAEFLPD